MTQVRGRLIELSPMQVGTVILVCSSALHTAAATV